MLHALLCTQPTLRALARLCAMHATCKQRPRAPQAHMWADSVLPCMPSVLHVPPQFLHHARHPPTTSTNLTAVRVTHARRCPTFGVTIACHACPASTHARTPQAYCKATGRRPLVKPIRQPGLQRHVLDCSSAEAHVRTNDLPGSTNVGDLRPVRQSRNVSGCLPRAIHFASCMAQLTPALG